MIKSAYAQLVDRDWLYSQYVEKMRSSGDIAKEVGCHWSAVVRALSRHGIQKRKRTSKYPLLNDKEWLRRMYVDEKLSTREIGKLAGGAAGGVVYSALAPAGITPRTDAQGISEKYPDGRFGAQASNWQGGRRPLKNGYVYIYKPEHPNATANGCVFEHILEAEKKIGRYLKKGEIVHHVNGNKADISPENLLVCTRQKHVQIHMDAVKEVFKLRERIVELEKELGYK